MVTLLVAAALPSVAPWTLMDMGIGRLLSSPGASPLPLPRLNLNSSSGDLAGGWKVMGTGTCSVEGFVNFPSSEHALGAHEALESPQRWRLG